MNSHVNVKEGPGLLFALQHFHDYKNILLFIACNNHSFLARVPMGKSLATLSSNYRLFKKIKREKST